MQGVHDCHPRRLSCPDSATPSTTTAPAANAPPITPSWLWWVCRTCNFEHKYRGNKTGKKELTKEEAFNQLLASAQSQLGIAEQTPKKKR
jgi:hypothetical protein